MLFVSVDSFVIICFSLFFFCLFYAFFLNSEINRLQISVFSCCFLCLFDAWLARWGLLLSIKTLIKRFQVSEQFTHEGLN